MWYVEPRKYLQIGQRTDPVKMIKIASRKDAKALRKAKIWEKPLFPQKR